MQSSFLFKPASLVGQVTLETSCSSACTEVKRNCLLEFTDTAE